MEHLDNVKSWLDSCDIAFSEGPLNLNWPTIMKTVNEDPAQFFKDGGWKFLETESDDEDGDQSESASEFEMSEDDFEEEESEDDDSEFDEDASVDEGSEMDDESGEDWSELEEEGMVSIYKTNHSGASG
jgi:nucleosome binding factor SPN SPT16 subunit